MRQIPRPRIRCIKLARELIKFIMDPMTVVSGSGKFEKGGIKVEVLSYGEIRVNNISFKLYLFPRWRVRRAVRDRLYSEATRQLNG